MCVCVWGRQFMAAKKRTEHNRTHIRTQLSLLMLAAALSLQQEHVAYSYTQTRSPDFSYEHTRTHARSHRKPYHMLYLITINSWNKIYDENICTFRLKSCLNPTPHSWTEVNSSDRFSVPIYRFCFFSPAQKRKLSSPRINFPIYPIFITSFIKRDSYVLVFLLPHRLKKRYIGKQLPRTLGEICFFLSSILFWVSWFLYRWQSRIFAKNKCDIARGTESAQHSQIISMQHVTSCLRFNILNTVWAVHTGSHIHLY